MNKKFYEAMRQQYANCVNVDVVAFNDGTLFEVSLKPLENEQRESFIKDVRALLEKYFSGKYYDFEVSDDE